jgi:ABC-type Mn2+/Zn2+ transport system ATPase subunit
VTDNLLLTINSLAVGYDRAVVRDGIHLEFKRGLFTGLLGPNGSGKSTLLKTIAGILPPVGGTLEFHRINGRDPIIGYVPQREALDPVFLLSSLEVVLMGATVRVRPGRFFGKSERDWARHCLEETGAMELAHTRFSQLSGGQKQRVLIARALATKPDFLLLDEPTSGIDAAATQAIMDVLRTIHREQGMTILMVSHDFGIVRRFAQEVIWLHQDKVLQGPVAELLSREKIEEIMELEFD